MTNAIRPAILIVEDQRIVALDIQQMLHGLGYDPFAIACSAEQALARAGERHPDLVLMDIRIQGERDGIQAAKLLRDRFDLPIIYLTAHADEATLDRAKRTEPHGYLLKPVREAELRSIVEVTLYKYAKQRLLRSRHTRDACGRSAFVKEAAGGTKLPDSAESGAEHAGRESTLSTREREVLVLIVRGHTSKEIAAMLRVAKPTVDTYRKRLGEKLGARGRAALVKIALRSGLLGPSGTS
jgi:two-component system, response regulator PdtaR